MEKKPLVTVFTPSYNRAGLLGRVYASLKNQTFRDFEWIIVDDGSGDNTREIAEKFIAEKKLEIIYYYQENGHKKKAFNSGVKNANGEFFIVLDSDDELKSRAIEKLLGAYFSIAEKERKFFSGVCGLCEDDEGHIVGDRFPKDIFDSNSLDIFYKYDIKGEKQGFIKTDILKKNLFPEDVSGHVPEGIVWSKIALSYRTRFINEVVRIYHKQEESIMNSPDPAKNCQGHLLWYGQILNNELKYFFYKPLWFMRCSLNYSRFKFNCSEGFVNPGSKVRNFFAIILVWLFYPAGFILFLVDRIRK